MQESELIFESIIYDEAGYGFYRSGEIENF